ncbi:hypothetical protein BAY1663_03073 [Pseudomonas sp. BAY1663]|nr:hypothetical protein BAY1663_03073 [Pseudomonas sp. BAY1663]
MHISVLLFVLVSGFFVVPMFFTKATQVQPTDVLDSQSHCPTAFQNSWQERFKIRPDPVEQVCLSHVANVRRTQCEVMGRCPWRQEYTGFADSVLYGSGNQLERLDTGQYADFCKGRRSEQQSQHHAGEVGQQAVH